MKLTLLEHQYLKDSISIISELVNEARIKITRDGIEIKAVDPVSVAMINYKLLSSAFSEYTIEEEKEIGINLLSLKQILGRLKNDDVITIEAEENMLKLSFKHKSTRTFTIPIIEVDPSNVNPLDFNFNAKIEINSVTFANAIQDADIVSEEVTLLAEQGKFTIKSKRDVNSVTFEVEQGNDAEITVEEPPQKNNYSVEYLKKMAQSSKIAERVKIEFKNDHFLNLTYRTIDRVELSFILAPREELE